MPPKTDKKTDKKKSKKTNKKNHKKGSKNLKQLKKAPIMNMWGDMLTPSPFPPINVVKSKFVYAGTLTTNTTANTFGSEVIFALNDIVHCGPGVNAGTGVYELSLLSAIYRQAKVLGCAIKVTFEFPTAAGIHAGAMLSVPSNPTSLANRLYTTCAMEPESTVSMVPSTGSQKWTLNKYIPGAIAAGTPKLMWDADINNYSQVIYTGSAASPTLTSYVRLAIADELGVSALGCSYTIELMYTIKCYDKVIV